jgi:hypothetical protein
MSVWNLLYKELTGTHDYIKPNTPATQKQIAEVEKVLDCKLPTDLKELLLEMVLVYKYGHGKLNILYYNKGVFNHGKKTKILYQRIQAADCRSA